MCAPSVRHRESVCVCVALTLTKREGRMKKETPSSLTPCQPIDRTLYFYAERVAVIYRFLLKFALTYEAKMIYIQFRHTAHSTAIFHCDEMFCSPNDRTCSTSIKIRQQALSLSVALSPLMLPSSLSSPPVSPTATLIPSA